MNFRTIILSLCFFLAAFAVQAQNRKVTLLSPTNGQSLVPVKTVFTWDTLAVVVDSFELQISKNTNFSDTMLRWFLPGTQFTYTLSSSLDYDSTYYWRVISFDTVPMIIETSDVFAFTVVGPPPGQPTNFSPASASLDVSVKPTLTWSGVIDADEYHIQISTFTNFSDTAFYGIVNAPGTSVNVSVKLESYKVYYWRVVASNQNGKGEWSNYWNFTTLVTGLHKPEANFSMNCFPNPTNSGLTLSFEGIGTASSITMLDMQGKVVQVVLNETLTAGNHQVAIKRMGLPAGMYFIQLQQNGQTQTKKVVFK